MSATMTSRIPPSYLANTCLALSAFIIANNTNILLNPRNGLKLLGFPTPETHADQKLVDGIVRMGAATRISLGLSSVAVWWYSDYRAMAWGTLSGTVMAIVDGWVSKEVSGGGQWNHWGAIPIGVGLGTGLLALCGV